MEDPLISGREHNVGSPLESPTEPISKNSKSKPFETSDFTGTDKQDECLGFEPKDEEAYSASTRPLNGSEKRRAENSKFLEWVGQQAAKEELPVSFGPNTDEVLTLKGIIARQESETVIEHPRDYQMELFERAKSQNTIAVLDTGSGKTFIAVLLLRHIIDRELEDRAVGKPPRIAFFLVNKVALVFQQAAVLQANLDHEIEQFCGAMGCDLWSKQVWDKHFEDNKIIVCTANILQQCLFHGFIRIEQINILIFDEAHHAKKDHSYARIIKDFYMNEAAINRRPHIFGMTASPVDAKNDVHKAASELEALLHSQIATVKDMKLLQKSGRRLPEEVARYRSLPASTETKLYNNLIAKFGDTNDFVHLFEHAKDISSELGLWCSDLFWHFAFSDEQVRKWELKAEQRYYRSKKNKPVDVIDAKIARLKEAHLCVQEHELSSPSLQSPDLSFKILLLNQHLQRYFGSPSDTRCLVFVEKRYTARILEHVFNHIGGPHLHLGILIGSQWKGLDNQHHSFKQQALTLMRFRKGELNCLFATSIAEEGLDIQDCNLVIRFDPCLTMIQYLQSRGRARRKNSKFVHFVEDGNILHEQKMNDIRDAEIAMRAFCQSLPEDRLLEGNEVDVVSATEKLYRTYTEESTGAKLTYDLSLVVLAHFCSLLPNEDEEDLGVNYVVSLRAGKFICEVILPLSSPIRSAIGQPASRKATAKRSAAFEACIQLRKEKYLDANLLPIYTKQLPAMRNALLAIHDKSTSEYLMQSKPAAWEFMRGQIPPELFLTAISVEEPWERPVKPIGLLTRFPLLCLPKFPLYSVSGRTSNVQAATFTKASGVNSTQMLLLTNYTLRVFKELFNKTFEHDEATFSYWVAPLCEIPHGIPLKSEIPIACIDWDALETAQNQSNFKWSSQMADEFLADKFIIDPWDGGRRFFSKRVVYDLTPSDPVPENTAKGRWMENIMDYSVSLSKKTRIGRQWNLDQPVVEAEMTVHRLNVLASPQAAERQAITRCFICPEPLEISVIPAPIAAMFLLFPAIIHKIDSYMVAVEACAMIKIRVAPALALEAITKDIDITEDHRGERMNFQSGMGPNYERLEFIGDCFLKMATSVALFSQNASSDEYKFHVDRMIMVCNQNLYNNALESKIYKYIRSLSFSRRTWYPEGLTLLEGIGANKDTTGLQTQKLAKKTIADVCEALIGAAFMSHVDSGYCDSSEFDDAVKAVTRFVNNAHHTMDRWSDYFESYKLPAYQTAASTASQRDLVFKVKLEHDYDFQYPRLLRSAFTHPSLPTMYEEIPNYQRLEFLGDSLLDMTSVTYLFNNHPKKDPQWLTDHKMAMVSNKFLGALCVKIGFHKHLRHNSPHVQKQIQDYVRDIEEAENESNGARDYWTLVGAPPKCLADIIESYVGAVFVDSSFSFAQVQRFFDMHIKWFFEDVSIYDTFAHNHPITMLNHILVTTMGCTSYRLLSSDVRTADGTSPSHFLAGLMIHGEVVASGRAESSRIAKVNASLAALELVQGLPRDEYRIKFACSCRGEGPKQLGQVDETPDTAM